MKRITLKRSYPDSWWWENSRNNNLCLCTTVLKKYIKIPPEAKQIHIEVSGVRQPLRQNVIKFQLVENRGYHKIRVDGFSKKEVGASDTILWLKEIPTETGYLYASFEWS